MSPFAGGALGTAQRLLASEAVLKGLDIVSADVPKAFLQGIRYADLAAQTGEPLREVCFTVPPATAAELRQIPGYEDFEEKKIKEDEKASPNGATADAEPKLRERLQVCSALSHPPFRS